MQESKAAYEQKLALLGVKAEEDAEVVRTVTCKSQDAASGASKSADPQVTDADPPDNFCGPPDPWVEIIDTMIKKYM